VIAARAACYPDNDEREVGMDRKPQPDAKAFIERASDPKKVLVVTTSGSGKERLAGVDAISAASVMEDVPTRLGLIESRLDAQP
jgi:hypothetical protein